MSELDPISAAFGALQPRLQTFFKPKLWDFHIVADPMSIDEFKAIVRRTPCLGLGWRQFNPAPSDKVIGRRFQGNLGLRLTIVVKNPNGPKSRFLSDAAGPGLFPSIASAIALVNGFTVAGLGTFAIGAAAQAYAEGYDAAGMAMATVDIGLLTAIGDVDGDLANAPGFLRMISEFEPWPDGQERDAPLDVRQP
ncbi:hypothetical protein [Bosea sp. TND4EK4]|uniref:hypothetical protein n=1 Tax=Bosea sp. TND4EK4 TaxID=1907408 RepID=UPI000956D5AE|nr:hypothetical protein [Bosea sp. TND4EK4]SIP96135.1 hypothetical protein SAMN05880592_101341 [Bosea sp. TND4EK4]